MPVGASTVTLQTGLQGTAAHPAGHAPSHVGSLAGIIQIRNACLPHPGVGASSNGRACFERRLVWSEREYTSDWRAT